MSSKSKTKGNNFEREISTYLSELYGLSFLRVPNSGAYVGGLNAQRRATLASGQIKTFRGDIIPPDDCTIVIECKNYADFPFHSLLKTNTSIALLNEWINEVETDAGQDFWLLFFKVSRKGTFVCWHTKYFKLIQQKITYLQNYHISELEEFFSNNKSHIEEYMRTVNYGIKS